MANPHREGPVEDDCQFSSAQRDLPPTRQADAGKLGSPAYDCHWEQQPPPKGSVICSWANSSKQQSHSGKADTVRNQNYTCDCFRSTTPWKYALSGCILCETWRPRSSCRVVTSCSGEGLKQGHGEDFRTDALSRAVWEPRILDNIENGHYSRCNTLCYSQDQ